MSLSCVKNINTVASPKYCRVALQRMRPDKWNERRCVLLVSTHALVKDVTTTVWMQQEFIYSFNSRTAVRYDQFYGSMLRFIKVRHRRRDSSNRRKSVSTHASVKDATFHIINQTILQVVLIHVPL
jgi:hypothetical protein